jgi:hypothetical protein
VPVQDREQAVVRALAVLTLGLAPLLVKSLVLGLEPAISRRRFARAVRYVNALPARPIPAAIPVPQTTSLMASRIVDATDVDCPAARLRRRKPGGHRGFLTTATGIRSMLAVTCNARCRPD